MYYNHFQRKLLDASLGFAGGVMLAASYWSLLEPAIEMAEKSKIYGEEGKTKLENHEDRLTTSYIGRSYF